MNVELQDARWFKSNRSGGTKECVEAAFLAGGRVGVRDSKNPAGPAHVFTGRQWDAFVCAVAAGKFDGQGAL
ncbi:DUF397 domain-containing protein [Nocardia yunnanensis]|uniref:DUF397 domain-containing protein n=1 Tax=Nocardia yunnanensis TaxID=2382165 RepID=UPI001CA3FC64|nr:DUF397 domain-containing protein [Nocardia yunnanensis]